MAPPRAARCPCRARSGWLHVCVPRRLVRHRQAGAGGLRPLLGDVRRRPGRHRPGVPRPGPAPGQAEGEVPRRPPAQRDRTIERHALRRFLPDRSKHRKPERDRRPRPAEGPMIKNERQYRLTRSQLERFRGVLDELRERPVAKAEELRHQVELAAVDAQVRELTAELEEYDSLRTGKAEIGPLDSLDDLPRLLIRARIASGLTQRDLAERLGMPEQQVQRYEANDWSTASLARLREV